MDKRSIYKMIHQNRFLIINCAVLIIGTVFGMSMLRIVPEEIRYNYYNLVMESSTDILNLFFNRFSFSFVILIFVYLSGTSVFGIFSAPFAVFLNGFFYGFSGALNYSYSGLDYIMDSMILFFTSAVFNNFIILIMAENAIAYSEELLDSVSGKNAEKPHYKAGKLTVKFIAFTAAAAFFSVVSALFTCFIRPVL